MSASPRQRVSIPDRRRRILLFNDLADLRGGADRSAALLAEEFDQERFQLYFASFQSGEMTDRLLRAGNHVQTLRASPHVFESRNVLLRRPFHAARFGFTLLVSGRTLAREIRSRKAELLYTYSIKGHLISLAALPWCSVAAVWDMRELSLPSWVVAGMCLLARSRVSAIVTQTDETKRFLSRWYPAKRVSHVSNGVDPAGLRPSRTPSVVRRELAVPSAAFVLVTAGWIKQSKALHVLISAMERVDDAWLLICGDLQHQTDEAYHRRCRDQVANSGLRERVRFLGFRSDLPDIIAASDLAVLPSASEQQNRFIMEAMVLRRAIIAADTCGTRDLLAPPRAGLVFPPGDPRALATAILRLKDDPQERHRLALADAARVRDRFSGTRFIRAMERVLLNTLDRREPLTHPAARQP